MARRILLLPTLLLGALLLHGVSSQTTMTTTTQAAFPPNIERVLDVTRPDLNNGTYCVTFSPFVQNYNPNYGPAPSPALIATLLDQLVATKKVNCIFTYGAGAPLDVIPQLAQERGLKVILSIWLSNDTATNEAEITRGIQLAQQFPDTVIDLNCGSEVRQRLVDVSIVNPIILNCAQRVKDAHITQPVSTSATWISLCDNLYPNCQQWQPVADSVDILLATVFTWWENIKAPERSACTPAESAPQKHMEFLRLLHQTYPGKPIILSEFGWPSGPEGYVPEESFASCSRAGLQEQQTVVGGTLGALAAQHESGIAFEAFGEPWKINEGPFGPYWGMCSGNAPFTCNFPPIMMTMP